jgi:hypothetical protein
VDLGNRILFRVYIMGHLISGYHSLMGLKRDKIPSPQNAARTSLQHFKEEDNPGSTVVVVFFALLSRSGVVYVLAIFLAWLPGCSNLSP